MRHVFSFAITLGFLVAVQPVNAYDTSKDVQRKTRVARAGNHVDRHVLRKIARYQKRTWHWQRVMGKRPTRTTNSARHIASTSYRKWVLRLWKVRAHKVWKRALRPPHKRAWLCIHRYEGRWNDPNAPYYGGLQMDIGFQRTYGAHLLRRKGTADKWSPLEQMWVAERALRSGRGFYPWPNAARICGLI